MSRPTLAVFVRLPRPGRVKTRLAAGTGSIAAAWWYRHQTNRLLRRVTDPRWRTVLAVADPADLRAAAWPARFQRLAQPAGSLGRRMVGVLRAVPGPVVVVGSDIPPLRAAHVAACFRALAGADVVLGPAEDGGYWAIGRRGGVTLPRDCLDGVRWSGPHARSDTEARLSRFRIARGPVLWDVDRAADLGRDLTVERAN